MRVPINSLSVLANIKLMITLTFFIFMPLSHSATVAWYKFDTGSTIKDSSANELNGSIQGTEWDENSSFNIYPDNAKSFNSSEYNTYVSIPYDSLFNCFGEKFTLECWYKNTGAPSGGVGRIIGKGDAYSSGFDLRIGSDNKIWWAAVYNNGGRIYLSSNTVLVDNTWHHIAVTAEDIVNGSLIDTKANIYIDGKLDATYTKNDSQGLKSCTNALQIMGSPGNNWFARGVITRVKISDDSLTQFDRPLKIRGLHLHLDGVYSSTQDNLLRADIDNAAAAHYTHIILHINNHMDYVNDPLEPYLNVYSRAQIQSLIEYVYSKKLKVIPAVRILTHADEMLNMLGNNTNYQPANPTPGQLVTSSAGHTANPYYSYNGHSFAGITTNIITEILSLFSELYNTGNIDYEYPDYLLAGFDELYNSELQYFIDQCGSQGDTVRSKFVETVNNTKSIVANVSSSKTKMIIWGDMFLSEELANAPYSDSDFATYWGPMNGTDDAMYLAVLNNEISQDVVIADWYYSASDNVGYPGIKFFSNKGYQTLGAVWRDLDAISCWANYVHNNINTLDNAIGMFATSWGDNNRRSYYSADRFEAMLPNAGSLFFEIGSLDGIKTIPKQPVLRCYAENSSLYYPDTFFDNSGNDTIYFSAYVNDQETSQSQLVGNFYVKPHGQSSWTSTQNITATDKSIVDFSGQSISLTYHGKYVIPSGATTGPWDIKFVYNDNDFCGEFSSNKTNYVVRENAFIINTTGENDFTRKSCIANYIFNLPSTSVPDCLPGGTAPAGTISGSDYQTDNTQYSYNTVGKKFNTSGYTTSVSVPHDTIFNCFGEKFTLECWYKNTGSPSSSVGRIIGKGDAYSSGFDLRYNNSDGKLWWAVACNNGGRIYLSSSTSLTDNTWYHIAVTAENIQNGNATDTKACIYINGKLDATYTRSNSQGMNASTSSLQIMGSPGNGWFVRGAISSVKIYDYALTREDIATGVLRMNFDEDSPSTYNLSVDHSRFFNPSNNSNISYTSSGADGTGKCAYFNGTNSTIRFPQYENLEINDSFNIRFKVKITEQPTCEQVIIQNGVYGDGFEIRMLTNSKLYFRFWTYANYTDITATANAFSSANSLTTGQWTDVVLSFDSSAKQIKLYMNGSLTNTINTTTGERVKPPPRPDYIILGKYCYGGLQFKGYMDEIILENEPYTP